MARQPRLAAAGHVHHVLLRGHDGRSVFRDDDDRAAFFGLMRSAALAEHVAVHGYVLRDDEVQLLVTPAEAPALSRLVQSIGRRYGMRFNRRHGHAGTLWSGRFRSSIVEPGGWVLRCLCYIEMPSGTAAGGADAWSSRAHHLGSTFDPSIAEHATYWSLGNTPFERELVWRQALERGLTTAEIQAIEGALRSGTALGDMGFLALLRAALGRRVSRRPAGRPAAARPS